MKPSIGRIVHFTDVAEHTCAAIVTGVIGDTNQVNLAIFNRVELTFDSLVPYSELPAVGCWSWPPRTGP